MSIDRQQEILIVEDQSALRRLIARILTREGFPVLEAGSASQGLEMVRTHRDSISLAIIDMIMPGMSGLDMAAELTREHPAIKILYTSGYGSSVAMESISQRTPEHVLLKPFTSRQLLDRVAQVLGVETVQEFTRYDAISRLTHSEFAWDRLMEGSDQLGPEAVEVVGYKDTGAAFAIAAIHAAALRASGTPYEFYPSEDDNHPFALLIPPKHLPDVRDLIESVGLGADIELAA